MVGTVNTGWLSETAMERYELTVEPGGVVTLPPELLNAIDASEGDYVLLDATPRQLVIRLATPEEVELHPSREDVGDEHQSGRVEPA